MKTDSFHVSPSMWYIVYPIVPSLACFSFNRFSCFINSLIQTGIPLNKSSLVKSVSNPVPQFVSLPPPSSSMLINVCEAPLSPSPNISPVPLNPLFFLLFLPCSYPFSFLKARSASFLAAAHSSSSSPYRSQTQFTQPLIQQLSGSSGRGGTHTPATSTDFFWISERRSKGEERREEKRILGSSGASERVVEIAGVQEGIAVVGGLLVIAGVEDWRIEA
jgi:hypothetical protein